MGKTPKQKEGVEKEVSLPKTKIDKELEQQQKKSVDYVAKKGKEKIESDNEYNLLNKVKREIIDNLKKNVNREEYTKWPSGFDSQIKKIFSYSEDELIRILNSKQPHQIKIKEMRDFRQMIFETINSFKEGERKEISLDKIVLLRRTIEQYNSITSESNKMLRSLMFERKLGTINPKTWQQLLDIIEPGIFEKATDLQKQAKDDSVKEAVSQTGGVLTELERQKKTKNTLDLNENATVLSMSMALMKPKQRYEFAYRILKSDKKELFPEMLDFMLKGAHLEVYQGKELARIALEQKACDPTKLAKVVEFIDNGTYEKFYEHVRFQHMSEIKNLKAKPNRNEALHYLSVPGVVQGAGLLYSVITLAGNFFAAFDIKNLDKTFEDFFTNPRVYSAAAAGVASYDALTGRRGLGTGEVMQWWYRDSRKHEKVSEYHDRKEEQFVNQYFSHPQLAKFLTDNYERINMIKKEKEEKMKFGEITEKEGTYEGKYTKITYEDIKNNENIEGFRDKFDSMEKVEWERMLNYMFHTAYDDKILKLKTQNQFEKRINILRERYLPSDMDKYIDKQNKIWQ